jgi:hypothetical protein
MAHVIFGDHGALELGQVVPVALAGLVEVAFVSNKLCEGIYREGGGHVKVLIINDDLDLRLNIWSLEKLCTKNPPTFHGESSSKAPHSIARERSFSPTLLRSRHIKGRQGYERNSFHFLLNSFSLIR